MALRFPPCDRKRGRGFLFSKFYTRRRAAIVLPTFRRRTGEKEGVREGEGVFFASLKFRNASAIPVRGCVFDTLAKHAIVST